MIEQKRKIAVLGGGSWATAIIKILCEGNVSIRWFLRSQTDIAQMVAYGHNPRYLSSVKIDTDKVQFSANILDVIKDAEIVVVAIPAAFVADALKRLQANDLQDKILISTVKGMIPVENLLITQYLEKNFGVLPENLTMVAGPCHAEEVAQERQSYLTIGGNNLETAELVANLFRCRFVKTSVIEDVDGAEFCAVMKNITAVACGMARGLGFGDNFQAVLVSNAMQEIKRFVDVVAPKENRDLNASAYLGDLLVTTYSQFSRNRTFGNMIGRGYSVKSAQMEMNMIAEGYYAAKCIYDINRQYKIEMPITKAVYHSLYEKISPAVEFQILRDAIK